MKGTIRFTVHSGWSYLRSHRLRPGLYSKIYRSKEGWTAQEVFRGRDNKLIGLQVVDSEGKTVGMCATAEDLP